MPITPEKLAERLKIERNRLDLTQEEVAERLGVKRPTIAQIEAGNRAVTSIELSQFAGVYKRPIEFFLAEQEPGDASGIMHLRAGSDLGEPVQTILNDCVELCRVATELEKTIGKRPSNVLFSYTLERPQTRWEAVEQGIRLASMERKRLDLGNTPVRNIVEIIAQHGVRVARNTLTDDLSGLFFVRPETGMAIIVNAGHSTPRRLFSYAHEYAHLLVDSIQTPGAVSRFGNRDDLIEVRANTFAVHFLLPAEGAYAFLAGVGGPSRQVMEVYDGFKEQPENREEELVTAQRRAISGSQEVNMIDVLQLSRHFGTSYEATVYQLLNLKVIQKEAQQRLTNKKDHAEQVNQLLGGPPKYLDQEVGADLTQMIINLTVEARLQKLITHAKACEYMSLVHRNPQMLDSLNMAPI